MRSYGLWTIWTMVDQKIATQTDITGYNFDFKKLRKMLFKKNYSICGLEIDKPLRTGRGELGELTSEYSVTWVRVRVRVGVRVGVRVPVRVPVRVGVRPLVRKRVTPKDNYKVP